MIDDFNDGIKKAVDSAYASYIKGVKPAHVHPRANEAKADYLSQIPGPLFNLMRDDIAAVWSLLESPIEQVAIFQFASFNYGRDDWPIFAKVTRERGKHPHSAYPVQIIPQAVFGRYRVDFLFDLGSRGLFAIECDGEEFHKDERKDRERDDTLREDHGVFVLRLPGKHIWAGNRTVSDYADLIKVYLR